MAYPCSLSSQTFKAIWWSPFIIICRFFWPRDTKVMLSHNLFLISIDFSIILIYLTHLACALDFHLTHITKMDIANLQAFLAESIQNKALNQSTTLLSCQPLLHLIDTKIALPIFPCITRSIHQYQVIGILSITASSPTYLIKVPQIIGVSIVHYECNGRSIKSCQQSSCAGDCFGRYTSIPDFKHGCMLINLQVHCIALAF